MNKNYENVKKWREKNKEKLKEQQKRYREKNKEKLNEYRRKLVEDLRAKGCTNAWRVIRGNVEPKYDYKVYKLRIDKAIDYIRDCCNMDSKWTNLHFEYAQNDMSSEQVDNLLEILERGKE